MTLKKTFLLLVLAFACYTNANTSYRTKRLEAIAQAVQLVGQDSLASQKKEIAYNHKPLRILKDQHGEIIHIGYQLFAEQIIEKEKSLFYFLTFIERYFLELDLQIDGLQDTKRTALDKIACKQGNIGMRKFIKDDTPCMIDFMERRAYKISWNIGKEILELTVPADCQLLLGANAIELEDNFERIILNTTPQTYIEQEQPSPHSFLSSSIRNDLFYQENNKKKGLIINEKSPVISIKNILLTGTFNQYIPMNLTLDRYGYNASEMTVDLQQFLTLCRQEGFQLYVGIKNVKSGLISATLFALNNNLGCGHVLSVEFPTAILSGSKQSLKGRLYVYIPLQNVTESFFMHNNN